MVGYALFQTKPICILPAAKVGCGPQKVRSAAAEKLLGLPGHMQVRIVGRRVQCMRFWAGNIWEPAIYVTYIHVSHVSGVSHARFFISLLDTTLAQKLTGLSAKNQRRA